MGRTEPRRTAGERGVWVTRVTSWPQSGSSRSGGAHDAPQLAELERSLRSMAGRLRELAEQLERGAHLCRAVDGLCRHGLDALPEFLAAIGWDTGGLGELLALLSGGAGDADGGDEPQGLARAG